MAQEKDSYRGNVQCNGSKRERNKRHQSEKRRDKASTFIYMQYLMKNSSH